VNSKTLHIADLFCGAGGTSTGALEALAALGYSSKLTAINHWDIAVSTHTKNHPEARHFCASLDSLNPRDLFTPGQLDILWASPECTHHSVARGGKPINDQSRATAWCVVRWAEALMPPVILIENVPEFITWGAIGADGRPMKSKKGATFAAWVGALESLGYKVGWKVLCAADYGDPTTRRRLFIQCVRGKRKVVWPDATHCRPKAPDLFSQTRRPWVTAREIIDWSIEGKSIYDRARPLKPKTMTRIMSGLHKFGLKPFITTMEHGGTIRSADRPLPTITTAKGGAMALTEPYLVKFRGTNNGADINRPAPTVTASGTHLGLAEPFLLPQQSCGSLRPVSEPAPTISTAGAVALIEPFLVEYYGNGRAQSVDDPLGTATTKERFGLARPELLMDGTTYVLDIRFRMLQPHELAAAQGFPSDYQFTGTKTESIKQIGNAVPRNLARSIVLAAVSQSSDIGSFLI
jgi:DNA (cytosine-5)-methyltransferase 1